MSIAENLEQLESTIASICAKNSLRQDVKLIAVSKTKPIEMIKEAYAYGQRLFGENKVQEGEQKATELADLDIQWHLIGPLQKNKVRKAVNSFNYIHSVDEINLAQRISRIAVEEDKKISILIQVNTSKEESKSGIKADKSMIEELAGTILELPNIKLKGLMTIGPLYGGEKENREAFALLRSYRDHLEQVYQQKFTELSMGMSSDYEEALKEGATFLRVGSFIFGSRA